MARSRGLGDVYKRQVVSLMPKNVFTQSYQKN
jgi:hypothetical protein